MKPYVVRYLTPVVGEVYAESTAAAVAQVLAPGVLAKGAIFQGAYPADGPVPPEFGGPPEAPPPATTPLRPKPVGGGSPAAGRLTVPDEFTLIPAMTA